MTPADVSDHPDLSRLFRPLIDTAVDAIIIVDSDGQIALWNKAAERIFGYSADEALGRDLHKLLTPPRYWEASEMAFAAFQAHGTGATLTRTRERIGLRRNGEEFPLELSLSAVAHDGRWIALGIVRDISDRKTIDAEATRQVEQIAVINAQLVEANQRLGTAQNQALQSEKLASIGLLAAGVAHEINNPVGYVYSNMGSLENYLADIFTVLEKYEELERSLDADDPRLAELAALKAKVDLDYLRTDIKALVAESREGLMRVKSIILDLKDFSRTGADEEWTWSNLHAGLNSTLGVVWNQLKYKCDVKKELSVLPPVECLPSQINQVIMNLLVNAAQSIEGRGTITIRTGRENDLVWIEIADTGKGIAPIDIPRIFDPFFTTKPVGVGTGLGLSVSYSIIKKHQGRIEVTSMLGKGSTFRIWLPISQHGVQNDHETSQA